MLSKLRERTSGVVNPVARAVVRLGVGPNALTIAGLLIGVVSAVFFARADQIRGTIFLLLCGGVDAIDGAVARISGKVTAFGGVLDSTADRYVDFLVLGGIAYGGLAEIGYLAGWVWIFLAMSGSFLVSYVRARSEAAGSGKLDVGIAERGERIIILAVGGFVSRVGYAVAVVAVLTHLTVFHRLFIARRRLK